jgi:hypothetical protein
LSILQRAKLVTNCENMSERETMNRYHEERKRKLEYNSQFDAERWAPILEGLTFATYSFPLTIEEGHAIANRYKKYILHHSNVEFSQQQEQLLQNLEDRIDDIIRNQCNGSAFIRMGSRSPKDTPLFDDPENIACARLKRIMKDKLHVVHNTKNTDPLLHNNATYCALMEAGTEALRIQNGKEAMQLLLNSERTYVDLLLALDFEELFSTHVVVRSWDDRLPYNAEFRCFVHNYSLNAISQYDNYCYFPILFQTEQTLPKMEKLMREFYENQVKPVLMKASFPANFVVDLGVLSDMQTVIVIEINPSDTETVQGTGSALFSWKTDRNVIEGGAEFELRVNRAPPMSNYETQVAPDWLAILKETEKQVIEENTYNNRKCVIC